ncbi:hypothetical protein [Altibacter sp. HG106]|uniref:hypothetical protein n=1 Tax=Altibacter sp. HG106 TaxID=3023937 RepID=UPI002350DD99|nr:hypothetical protein [Altibacter sp. HG106]MDC7995639.1 hypothetical protein [Altibacter sp. HG106]
MFKKILAIALFFAILSCDKETAPEVVQQDENPLILKRLSYETTSSPECLGRFGEFNSEGKLSEVYFICNDIRTDVREYNYDSEGNFIGPFGNYELQYDDNGNLIRAEIDSERYVEYAYQDNFVTERSYNYGEEYIWYYVYEFSDTSYSQLLSVKLFDQSQGDVLLSHQWFKHSNGNVVEVHSERTIGEEPDLVQEYSYFIAYDDQINPWKLGKPSSPIVANSMYLIYDAWVEYSLAYYSSNNIKEIQAIDYLNDTSTQFTFEYTYNDEMYPTNATHFIAGNPWRTILFEYYE